MQKYTFRNSCQEVALGDVRFASAEVAQELSLEEGDDVEVMWKNKGDAPTQWYAAKVRNIKVNSFKDLESFNGPNKTIGTLGSENRKLLEDDG